MAFDPLSIFTGSSYDKAAEQQRGYLGQQLATGQGNITNAQNLGLSSLQSGLTGGLGALSSGTGQARSDILGGLDPALAALLQGQAAGAGALTGAQTGALGSLAGGVSAATNAYSPLAGLSAQYAGYTNDAANAQRDALGLNGPEGIARAQQSFQTTPGYDFAKNQAIDSAVRGANTAGMAAGGNTLAGITNLVGNQIAPAQWQQYMSGLTGQQGLYAPLAVQGGGAAAGGIANAALTGGTGAANIQTGTGTQLSNLFSNTGQNIATANLGAGTSLANLASSGGLNAANLYSGVGGQEADLIKALSGQSVGLTQNLATPYASTYGNQAAAQTQGSANLWNLLGNAATFAGTGGLSTAAKGLSSLGNLFS